MLRAAESPSSKAMCACWCVLMLEYVQLHGRACIAGTLQPEAACPATDQPLSITAGAFKMRKMAIYGPPARSTTAEGRRQQRRNS